MTLLPISASQYHRWRRSPAYALAPDKPSASTALGSLIHALYLEGVDPRKKAVIKRYSWASTDGFEEMRQLWEYATDTAAPHKPRSADVVAALKKKGLYVVAAEDVEIVHTCAANAAIAWGPAAELGDHIEGYLSCELAASQIRLSGRVDIAAEDAVIDLKTTSDMANFRRQLASLRYDLQMATYDFLLSAQGVELSTAEEAARVLLDAPLRRYCWAVVETSAPHHTAWLELDAADTLSAREEWAEILTSRIEPYATDALTRSLSPSADMGAAIINLPAWARE